MGPLKIARRLPRARWGITWEGEGEAGVAGAFGAYQIVGVPVRLLAGWSFIGYGRSPGSSGGEPAGASNDLHRIRRVRGIHFRHPRPAAVRLRAPAGHHGPGLPELPVTPTRGYRLALPRRLRRPGWVPRLSPGCLTGMSRPARLPVSLGGRAAIRRDWKRWKHWRSSPG